MTRQQIKEEFAHLSSLKDEELQGEVDMDYYEAWYKPNTVEPTKRQMVVTVIVGIIAVAAFITNLIILFGR